MESFLCCMSLKTMGMLSLRRFEVNTPGGNISRLVANFPNFHFAEVDRDRPGCVVRGDAGSGGVLPLGSGAWRWCMGM